VFDSLFAQPLSKSSLVYLLVCYSPPTSYSIHFFTQSLTSFHNTCLYHCNLLCCTTEIMSTNPSSLTTLYMKLYFFFNITRLGILISARWSATSFSFLTGRPRSHFHATYYFAHNCCTISLSLVTTNDISLLVSNSTNCLNLFHPFQIHSQNNFKTAFCITKKIITNCYKNMLCRIYVGNTLQIT